jgi:Suppressor of fused protein (SUFU)
VSEYVHLDLLMVEPRDGRPVHTVVTSGMSSKPMENGERMELLIVLPPTWPMDEASWHDERHYWPIRALKDLARMPHAYGFSLDTGHTVPNGDPPRPYGPGTKQCGALIAPPMATPGDDVEGANGPVAMRAVYFLYEEEMQLKLERGYDALLDALDEIQILEVVEPDRPSAVKKKRFRLF